VPSFHYQIENHKTYINNN